MFFCKSHAYSYAQLVWQLAFMKANKPKDFWKATLNHCKSSYRKWVHFFEASIHGINVLELNFFNSVNLCNYLIPKMKKNGWGRIVNITSCAGLENMGPVTYGVAKSALTAYTRTMGRILATESKNIVMSAVFPGVVITKGGHWDKILKNDPKRAKKYIKERMPLGRFGKPSEISPIVVFHCSQLASFSHGAIVPADAGQSRHYMYFNYLS